MQAILAVFVGGGAGSVARFLVGKALAGNEFWFSFGTFAANMISSLILGYLLAANLKSAFQDHTQLLLMVGFCGGFSTFSTFSLENYQLIENGNLLGALLYAGLSIFLGLLCIYAGVRLGNA